MPEEFNLYAELKGWQGAIGSVLGFIALMLGALFNFHLNRQRDAAQRAEEAQAIAAALYGEIVLLRRQVRRVATMVAHIYINESRTKFDKHFLEAHTLSDPTLYRALAGKIGMLSADLVLAITQFHENYQEVRTWLPLLGENEERGYVYSVAYVLEPARDAVRGILPTLRTIEHTASIATPAEELDLSDVDTALDITDAHEEIAVADTDR